MNGYELEKQIGEGDDVIVMLAKHKRTREYVAIKIIDKIQPRKERTAQSFERLMDRIKREVRYNIICPLHM